MTRISIAVTLAALTLGAYAPAAADEPATPEEVASVTAALAAVNCQIGPEGVERDDDGDFEVEDATCPEGTVDIELNSQFQIEDRDDD